MKAIFEEAEALLEAKAVDDYPWPRVRKTGEVRLMSKLKVGRLGVVSYDQALAHEGSGQKKHVWGHESTYGAGRRSTVETRSRCSICGATKVSNAKGKTVYR